jgi:hypothetical protein
MLPANPGINYRSGCAAASIPALCFTLRGRRVWTYMHRISNAKGDKTYGVDEFRYFIDGAVKLISIDGTVQVINAGEAVIVPYDWQGTWDTKGYKVLCNLCPER